MSLAKLETYWVWRRTIIFGLNIVGLPLMGFIAFFAPADSTPAAIVGKSIGWLLIAVDVAYVAGATGEDIAKMMASRS